MNDEQSESNAEESFFNQARRIEEEMKAIMTRQLRLAIVQVLLGIVSIVAGFLIASIG